jgi:hypothetical protein
VRSRDESKRASVKGIGSARSARPANGTRRGFNHG